MKTHILLVGIIVLFFCACSDKKDQEKEESVSTVLPDQVSEVKAMKLEYTDFNHELISNGTVSVARKADLRFLSQENVAEVYVKNGSRVVAGQKIAALDQFKLQNSLETAKDNQERARLELQDVLIGQGYSLKDTSRIPPEVMKIAKIKSNFDQSRIQYELAAYNFKNSILYAPFNGVVANLFTKVHNIPDASQPFCTVVDNGSPELDFMILENELALIKVGDKVKVTPFAIPNYTTEGNISEINPLVDKNGMVRVKATVSNVSGKLYDGMNVKVCVQQNLGKRLIIPKEALVLRSNKKVVFTLKNGTARWVYVEIGLENSTGYEVIDKLFEGDSVIYEGNINLAHEAPVTVRN